MERSFKSNEEIRYQLREGRVHTDDDAICHHLGRHGAAVAE